jgi:predicted amidohydrolase YtcJ
MKRRDLVKSGLLLAGASVSGTYGVLQASDRQPGIPTRSGHPKPRGAGSDLALVNANLVTLEAALPTAQAVLVRNGRIALVGDNHSVMAAAAGIRIFDARGRTVVPGFIDAHVHFELTTAYWSYMVDAHVPPSRSLADISERLRKKVAETEPGRWVVGRTDFDLKDKVTEKRFMSRAELDAITSSHPLILFSGLHVAMLNTPALKALRLWDKSEADNLRWRNGALRIGSTIQRDAQGVPTGVVSEIADLFYDAHPYTVEEYKASIRQHADPIFLRKGITSIGSIPKATYDIVATQQLNVAGESPLRARYYIHTPLTIAIDAMVDSGLQPGFGNEMLRFGGIKIFVDGNGGDGLGRVYADVKWTQQGLTETVGKAHRAGLQCIMHCVTRTGFDMAVTAVAEAQRQQRKDLRHRIEHVSYLGDVADIRRLKELGIRVTITRCTPAERPPRSTPAVRTMVEEGLEPMAVSDSTGTVPEFSPMWGIASMMAAPEDGGAVIPSQALSFDQALRTWTLWPARALHEENDKGSIAVGKMGDFAVLSADPAKSRGKGLFDISVPATILGGDVIHEVIS